MQTYNTKIIDYGNGQKQVITYSHPITLLEDGEQKKQKYDLSYFSEVLDVALPDETELEKKALHSYMTSCNRTKNEVYKIARSNSWQWFITFTFDKDKVSDRTDYDALVKKVGIYFNNWKKRKCPGMKYLFVPEQHKKIEKNGLRAWHFHGLLANADGLTFIKLSDDEKRYYDINTDDDVYRIKEYKLGFCTATKVKDMTKVSHYITKYITKAVSAVLKNKRRYIYSRNCDKPMEYKYMCMTHNDSINHDMIDDNVYLSDLVDMSKVVYKSKKVIDNEYIHNEYNYYELQGE